VKRRAVVVSLMGFFLISLDMMIVNVALTAIRAELGDGIHGQQWVVDGYTLTFAALLLLGGNITERWGAKRVFGAGVAVFTLTSLACAAAPALGPLIAARFVQGAAAAAMLPASMTLIREAYTEPGPRARALSIWAMGGAAAATIGPLLGGFLTTFDWRLVFWINLPVGAVIIGLLVALPESHRHRAPFDWAGQATATAGLAALTFALIEAGAAGWTAPEVLAGFGIAAAALTAFGIVQARIRHPLIPPGLLTSRAYRVGLAAGFTFAVAWFGTVFVLSLFLQQHLRLEPLVAGLAFLASSVLSVPSNIITGSLTARFGPRRPIVWGQVAMLAGLLGLAITAPLEEPWLVAVLIFPLGCGGAFTMPAVTSMIIEVAPPNRTGSATAIFNMVRQVGAAIAIALFGAALADDSTFVGGVQLCLAIAATGIAATTVLAWLGRPEQVET
jgi:DHA2 family methylenomycin A resistance protein-like MFS transporter